MIEGDTRNKVHT